MRVLAGMFKLRTILVAMVATVACTACDPLLIRHYSLSTPNPEDQAVKQIVANVAQQFGLEKEGAHTSGKIEYARKWDTVKDGHPNAFSLFLDPTDDPRAWSLTVTEWLVFRQSAYGKEIDRALEAGCTSAGYHFARVP
jgi:hypothetical protein